MGEVKVLFQEAGTVAQKKQAEINEEGGGANHTQVRDMKVMRGGEGRNNPEAVERR